MRRPLGQRMYEPCAEQVARPRRLVVDVGVAVVVVVVGDLSQSNLNW